MVAGEHQKMQEPCTCDQKVPKRRQGGRKSESESMEEFSGLSSKSTKPMTEGDNNREFPPTTTGRVAALRAGSGRGQSAHY